ncbi:hypothetical protein DB313_04490 [Borrelia turcica IST7]|uniref:Uncharacterized protein n=1 Tax=Borrelia turcica IST7 TaxID=1104446 RepID=A0A386PPQ8_9SPIR|nr:hypothetical protein DB313_04490 [Borrelia turcica IST7]
MRIAFTSAVNLISSATAHLKSASEKTHEVSEFAGINIEEIKKAKDKAISADVALACLIVFFIYFL